MKKTLLILGVSLTLVFSSCRKENVCECVSITTVTDSSGTFSSSGTPFEISKESIIIILKGSEKSAKESCEKGSTSSSSYGGVVRTNTTCSIR